MAGVPRLTLGDRKGMARQGEHILCGTTSGEREIAAQFPDGHWHDHYTDAKPVVFGHHVTGHTPLIRDGRVFGLDTGACHGGNLTALCLPSFTIHAVPAHADHWALVKRQWQLPVLRSRPWRDLTWPEIARTIARFRTAPDDTGRWLDALEGWAAQLQSCFPTLLAEARRLAGELTIDEVRRHRAARFLFQARSGRLDQDGVARHCSTPGATMDLASALGRTLPKVPDTPE